MKTQEWLIVDKAGQSAWYSTTQELTAVRHRELFACSRGPIRPPVAFTSRLALLALLGLLGCASPEHRLLWSTTGGGETTSPEGQGGVAESPDSSGLPTEGRGGAACAGPGCPDTGGQLPTKCKVSPDCEPGFVCSDGQCVACNDIPHLACACPPGWTQKPMLERGCPVCGCFPPKGCSSDLECPAGEICYAGAACDFECLALGAPPGALPGSLECCFGNLCGMPGCPPPRLDCLVVGCQRPQDSCQSSCANPVCTCDRRGWLCDPTCAPGTSRCVPM
jgi:hypothetical protein